MLRVLAPGGLLASFGVVVVPAVLAMLPEALRSKWERTRPFFCHGLLPHVQQAGLEVLVCESVQVLMFEGPPVREAAELGVTLHVTYEHLLARKTH
jgi:hypothetical protein